MKLATPFAITVALVISACQAVDTQPASRPAYDDALIKDVPHIQQKPDFCGEACAEMASRHLGRTWTQDQVFNAAGVDPALGRGCYAAEMNTALLRVGFKTGEGWYKLAPAKLDQQLQEQWKSLHADLLAGIPSIACMHYSDRPDTTEHFRLILGYDSKSDEVIYHEPAEADGAYRRMKRPVFLSLWPLKVSEQSSIAIRFRLDVPAKLADPPVAEGFTPADFAQHVMQLKTRVPKGFAIVVQPPFVVIGDETPADVQAHATTTVKFAVDRLRKEYFSKDPADILDVWLFRDEKSYGKYTSEIFHTTPTTPYGYFSSADKALIMNIKTGGGTLVHEIVHPFMATNFPECPAWFNEGMGSLYEQCGDKNGHINGFTNWRLRGLQSAIKAGAVPSFKDLTAMDPVTFYNKDKGTNYGQARYLCYYLQEQGLLTKFYQDFTANKKDDPTGIKTLQKVLGEADMVAFKKKWEGFVMKLTFP